MIKNSKCVRKLTEIPRKNLLLNTKKKYRSYSWRIFNAMSVLDVGYYDTTNITFLYYLVTLKTMQQYNVTFSMIRNVEFSSVCLRTKVWKNCLHCYLRHSIERKNELMFSQWHLCKSESKRLVQNFE